MTGLNKTGIEWATHTCNPIVGCEANCPYCYARQAAKRSNCPDCRAFRPHFHPERLAGLASGGQPKRIFLGSMCDLWRVRDLLWIKRIWEAVEKSPHQILTLTKNLDQWSIMGPKPIPDNMWFGITAVDQVALDYYAGVLNRHWFAYRRLWWCFEPLLGPIDMERVSSFASWIVIGGLSGTWLPPRYSSRKKFRFDQVCWARRLIAQAREFNIPVFVKTKPVRIPDCPAPQEFPKGLRLGDE